LEGGKQLLKKEGAINCKEEGRQLEKEKKCKDL
jgi:hypothetical protein